jgi:hypothetical protein
LRTERAVDGRVERLWTFLAGDRPDRLEVRFALAPARHEPVVGLAPGDAVVLESYGEPVFRGEVDSAAVEVGPDGRWLRCLAYPGFHRRRSELGPLRLRRVTDAEVARAIADALGLLADVEPTSEVHDAVEVEGDPLRYLRSRAERCGFRFGVLGRRLAFRSEWRTGRDAGVVTGGGDVVSAALTDSRERGRSGKIEVRGDPRWRPCSRFGLVAVPGLADGRYRAERVLHLVDAFGYRTVVEFSPVAEAGGAA